MAPRIIGEGKKSDPQSLCVVTRKGTFIPNVQPDRDWPPDKMRAAVRMVMEDRDSARLRSATCLYNCVGMVFASRRTMIDRDDVPWILDEDGYRRVESRQRVLPGDVVAYRQDDAPDTIRHVGVVICKRGDLEEADWEIWVLSQWGRHGEYIHREDDVPERYGNPTEYYTERRVLND